MSAPSPDRAPLLALLAAALLFGCAPPASSPPAPEGAAAERTDPAPPPVPPATVPVPPGVPVPVPALPADTTDSLGLRFRVSEGAAVRAAAPPRDGAVLGTPLSEAEAERLFRRVAGLRADTAPADSFVFPPQGPPPPRTGITRLASFPAPDTVGPPRPAAPAPLRIARRAPEGEIETGAEVTISFSQPMVPLASVSELAGREVPVRLSPQPAGRWRWLDVATLRFEPVGRMPMATVYTVEVPAGTRAAAGGTLAEPARWSFATPAPRLLGGAPRGSHALRRPVVVLHFDQRVDPAAVLPHLRMLAARAPVPLRLATPEEVEADSLARQLVQGVEPGRWVAVRPERELPAGAAVRVVVAAGTPSAEGPRRSERGDTLAFQTYGALRLVRGECGGRGECRPGTPWVIQLSNPIDARSWDSTLVRVEPAVPDLRADVVGDRLVLRGTTRPRTRYRVTLSPRLRDVFGQALGTEQGVTFDVGEPLPRLWSAQERMVVLDPAGPPRVAVYSRSHARLRVRVNRVTPEQWPAFLAVQQQGPRPGSAPALPGETVVSRVMEVDAGEEEVAESWIDLSPALRGGLGHALVLVEPEAPAPARPADPRVYREPEPRVLLWVQATRIGLSAFADALEVTGWATSLVDGAPLAGVELALLPSAARAATGPTGLATLPTPTGPQTREGLLLARRGGDTALLPENAGRGGYGGWSRQLPASVLLWHVFTDRGLYRPGEEVRFKGWIRRGGTGKNGTLDLPTLSAGELRYTVRDPQGNEIATGTVPLTALGGFDGRFTVPAGANLGHAMLQLEAPAVGVEGREHALPLMVQEFRRPEYEVALAPEPGPYLVGDSTLVTAQASYFAGGGLPGAEVRWQASAAPGHFSPPGWDRWSFGIQDHRWYAPPRGDGAVTLRELQGRTDAGGAHRLRLHFDAALPPRAHLVNVSATVFDVNRQAWSASSRLLVHPAAVYVGVRSERAWLPRGEPIELDLVVVDLDGRPVGGRPVAVRAARLEGRVRDGRWEEVEVEAQSCALASAAEPVRCSFRTDRGGRYRVRAEATDAAGRRTRTEVVVWVAGEADLGGTELGTQREVRLVPDRESYQPGQTAQLLVSAPFYPARGLLTLRRGGIVRTDTFTVAGPTHVLRVPIGEEDVPNVWAQVDLVGAAAPGQPEAASATQGATGVVQLLVPPLARTLSVAAVPRDTAAEPGARTRVEVEVRDAAGRPVAGAEVALVVVDEAVLALGGHRVASPLETFYRPRDPGTQDVHLRPLVLATPRELVPAPGTLVGVVLDAQMGAPLGGAQVEVEGTELRTLSDEQGRFRLAGLAPGTYTVRVRRLGHDPLTRRVRVVAGQAPDPLRFLLTSSVAPEEVVATAADFSGRGAAGGAVALEAAAAAPPPPPTAMPQPVAPQAAVGRAKGFQELAAPDVALRTDFDALALFSGALRTGADGRTGVDVTLPGNLTRYRVIAVAVSGAKLYGLGESAVTARKELMVRPSAPRFLNFGDHFELPVVVQNQGAAPIEVEVAVRASGVAMGGAGRRVTVPANDRVEIRVPGGAVRPGLARFQVVAAGGALADAAELTLPVWTPATAEAFATYGVVDSGAVTLPLDLPEGVIPGFGGLEVTTSATALQELTDALLYLVRYPFEHPEPVASRILAVAGLRDVLAAFRAEGLPSPEELADSVQRDLRRLEQLQNSDGGWGLWSRDERSWPYVSIHAAHALQRAREKGYAVPPATLARAAEYLRDIERRIPAGYPAGARRALTAYALYVRDRMGDRGAAAEAARLAAAAGVEQLPLEVAGWVLSTVAGDAAHRPLAGALARHLNNRATETAATATFATAYEEGEHLLLHSSRRSDAVVLEALIAAERDNPLIPKVVRGLLGHRTRGRWQGTQENAWVLLALDRYFAVYEASPPSFAARVWLDERFAGGDRFQGRTTDRHHLAVPMRALAADSAASLTLGKEGSGRMYYRAALRYAPADLYLKALESGFAVERGYSAVDDSSDVRRDAGGDWLVRAGARVRVTLTLVAPSRRLHVALIDPLPAGLEAVNPELRGSQPPPVPPLPPRPPARGRPALPPVERWGGGWWEHQALRDERAEVFTSLLPAGVYTYSYIARATTPGDFIVPPARAEEMYHPETFGRAETARVRVR